MNYFKYAILPILIAFIISVLYLMNLSNNLKQELVKVQEVSINHNKKVDKINNNSTTRAKDIKRDISLMEDKKRALNKDIVNNINIGMPIAEFGKFGEIK